MIFSCSSASGRSRFHALRAYCLATFFGYALQNSANLTSMASFLPSSAPSPAGGEWGVSVLVLSCSVWLGWVRYGRGVTSSPVTRDASVTSV